jgi:RimJ/RimL family protein N-acetyltransferase
VILETPRLILRPFREEDREANAAIFGDPIVRRFALDVMDRAAADARLDAAVADLQLLGFGMLAAEHRSDHAFIGTVGLNGVGDALCAAIPSHPRLQLVWQLDRRYWGQGLAPEGAAACLAHAWSQLHAPEVVAITYEGNLPSRRVMEKIGMRHDPGCDFEHPNVPHGHRLRPHVLYRIRHPALRN